MVLTDEYSFNPDTQKINECIARINDLQPRYQARGFSIEATIQPASQARRFKYRENQI